MNVLLIDDEQAMLTALSQLLSRINGVVIAGMAQSSAEAIAFVAQHAVDLAFIDIKIAEDNGLAVALELRKMNADLDIVFVTSHKEFALDAFDVYPLDYIVKPVSKQRLQETIERAVKRQTERRGSGSDTANAKAPDTNIPKRLKVVGLGNLQICNKQGQSVKWISRKSQELFAYLLLSRGNRAAKMQILEDLFHDREGKNSELYLNTSVYQLRKTLASHGLKEVLVTDRDQYQMNLEQIDIDFITFEKQLLDFDTINANNEEAAIATETMYTGDLFHDKPYEWALVERERLSDLYEAFAKRLAKWLLDSNQNYQAVQLCKKLVRRNELDEEANTLLLHGFAALKDRPSLQAQYKQYEMLLKQELNIRPSTELTKWYNQLW